MTTTEDLDELDPFDAHFQREPLPGAGVRRHRDRPSGPSRPRRGDRRAARRACCRRDGPAGRDPHRRVDRGEAGSTRRSTTGWQAASHSARPGHDGRRAAGPPAHLDPLLEAIDHCDHVIGRRPAGAWRAVRPAGSAACRGGWSSPCRSLDVHSPCRLHRREKLAAIPLQSASSFLDVEILAKATFLGHLIDEVDVPPLRGRRPRRGWWADLPSCLKRPAFRASASPRLRSSGRSAGRGRR